MKSLMIIMICAALTGCGTSLVLGPDGEFVIIGKVNKVNEDK